MSLKLPCMSAGDPNGIRTRAAAVKGRCPRPLNDGAERQNLAATDGQAYGRVRDMPNDDRSAQRARMYPDSAGDRLRFKSSSKVRERACPEDGAEMLGNWRPTLLLLALLLV